MTSHVRHLRRATSAGLACLLLGVTACGGEQRESAGAGGDSKTVTIYSSLPLQGAARPQSESLVNGIKISLEDAGSKGGQCTVRYVSLDDSTAQAGTWDPGATVANARKATQDESTVAYIGEFNSGASAIALPLTNEAGLLQLSPSNTAVGLTKGGEAAQPGEPEKYYPSGARTFVRIVPTDQVIAAALVQLIKEDGSEKLYLVNDKEVYGEGLAANAEVAAKAAGLEVLGNAPMDAKAPNYRSLASTIASSGPEAILFGGVTANNAVQLFKDLHAAMPDAKLYGPDGTAEPAFYTEVPPSVAERTKVGLHTLPPDEYPEEGKQFFEDYRAKYRKDPEAYAIYGFEAMKFVLDAMGRAEDCTSREQVVEQAFATKDRESVLGTYSIDKDGDTTIADYAAYRIEGRKLVFDKAVEAETAG